MRFQERDELLYYLVVTESSVAVFDHLHHAKGDKYRMHQVEHNGRQTHTTSECYLVPGIPFVMLQC